MSKCQAWGIYSPVGEEPSGLSWGATSSMTSSGEASAFHSPPCSCAAANADSGPRKRAAAGAGSGGVPSAVSISSSTWPHK